MDERLTGQRVRRRRWRGVVHGGDVGVREPVLVVHRTALHVAPAVEALVVLEGNSSSNLLLNKYLGLQRIPL